jgi:superfamily I DNA/RNA helicase
VLFLTFNRSLADAVDRLFDRLCTVNERSRVVVSTVSKFCQEYIRFRTDSSPYWDERANEELFREAVLLLFVELQKAGFFAKTNQQSSQFGRDRDYVFLAEEIDYIFGRFLHPEVDAYLESDRTGRGRGLTRGQRDLVLKLYRAIFDRHRERKLFDPRDLARAAYGLLVKSEPTRQTYIAVIVDEVQDLTEIELKVMRLLSGPTGSGLFLVGDGAQQIYKRGHSLQRIGINVIGRSFVLRKNYRNTREIFNAVNAFKQAFKLGQNDEQEAYTETSGIPPSSSGERPLLMIAANPEQELAAIVREVTYLVNRLKLPPNQICCMARNERMRESIGNALLQAGINAVSFRVETNFLPDAIPVSILHNSKGHEFRAVFLAGVFDGAIPLSYTHDEQELEQEASLLYVAMTRAKELLYLSFARSDAAGRPLKESRFLEPMRPHLDILDLAAKFR